MNRPGSSLSDQVLARYLASTATRAEIEQVQAWLESSDEHVQELREYRKIWERSQATERQHSFDTHAAWQRMQAQMHPASQQVDELRKDPVALPSAPSPRPLYRRLSPAAWAAAAALVLLLPWIGNYLWQHSRPGRVSVATRDNTFEKVLPDGTSVFLNYNSTLTFSDELAGPNRTVRLEGEAFFDVAPDADRPFIIDAHGTEIRVVGTSFNVKAYDEAVRVDVKSGKVEVRKSTKTIELLPGEGVEVLSDTAFRTLSADKNAAAYSTQIFDFEAAPLDEVVRSLSESYHTDIQLSNDQMAQCRLTGRYEGETLDATLAVIAETMRLQVSKRGTTYWLDGTGCR